MRLHLLAAAVGLTLALAGCASSGGLHPDGTPIDPSSLQAGRSLAHVPSDAAWPQADWWTGLGDPQLDALIAEALHDNPSLPSPMRALAGRRPWPASPRPRAGRA